MKKLLLGVLALGMLAIYSCQSDPCEGKTATQQCNGNGTLSTNGSACACACNAGYSGADCKNVTITTLVKSWSNATSQQKVGGTLSAKSGTTTISQAAAGNIIRLAIQNLEPGLGCNNGGAVSDIICYADIVDGNTIKLDETAQCGTGFKGTGTLQADGSWKFVYTATNANGSYECVTELK